MKRIWVAVLGFTAAILVAFCAISIAQEEKTLDDGEWLSCEGELIKVGERPALKVTDGDHNGKTFIILENARLEELEQMVKETGNKKITVSCDVTKYNKKNYIVITHFPRPGDEEEEESGDDDEEEEK